MKAPHEMTPEELSGLKYGELPGVSAGKPYDADRCAEGVAEAKSHHQCFMPPGHGPGGLYCKQHAKRYPTITTHDDPAIMQSGSSASWGIEPEDEATP